MGSGAHLRRRGCDEEGGRVGDGRLASSSRLSREMWIARSGLGGEVVRLSNTILVCPYAVYPRWPYGSTCCS